MELIGTEEELVERARGLSERGGRRLLGLTGAPGAGKSTLAACIRARLGASAALVPMDGFHLADTELVRLERRDCKGAIDTFDGAGYAALLERLRANDGPTVYAPEFRREIEDAVAGAIPIPTAVPLVITEGNYLLVDEAPWAAIRSLLDEVWYLDPPDDLRIEWLIARHVSFGKTPEDARAWSCGTDQVNADLVAATKTRADVIVRLA